MIQISTNDLFNLRLVEESKDISSYSIRSSQEFEGSVKQSKHFKGLDDQTIDAFEMDGYPRYNYMKSKQDAFIMPNNVSPPPKYNN